MVMILSVILSGCSFMSTREKKAYDYIDHKYLPYLEDNQKYGLCLWNTEGDEDEMYAYYQTDQCSYLYYGYHNADDSIKIYCDQQVICCNYTIDSETNQVYCDYDEQIIAQLCDVENPGEIISILSCSDERTYQESDDIKKVYYDHDSIQFNITVMNESDMNPALEITKYNHYNEGQFFTEIDEEIMSILSVKEYLYIDVEEMNNIFKQIK